MDKKNKLIVGIVAGVCVVLLIVFALVRGSSGGGSDLTDDEKKLLSHTFSEDSDSVKKGSLDGKEQAVLDDVRLAEKYLYDSYGQNFNFDMVNIDDGVTKVTFSTGDSDELYTLEVENGVCKDNYYGVIIHWDYDEAVANILKDQGIDCMVYTSFRQLANSGITVDEALKMGSDLNRYTDIFVNNKVDKAQVKQILEANNLYGSYELYSIKKISKEDKADTDSLEKLIRTGKLVSYDSFDTFFTE